jgi:cellulose synthase (UDP-forming)
MFLPQIIVLALNSAAIPIGLALAFTFNHLPKDALVFNTIWASVNLALGFAIFGFTKKTERFVRSEYRFPVPLPMRLAGSGPKPYVTIDNISSSGCRIYGRIPEGVKKGGLIFGNVILPLTNLNVKAEIVSETFATADSTEYLKSVGCRFLWDDLADQDALDLFLYGSDLQWILLELEDKSPTPGDWIRRRNNHSEAAVDVEDRWATCEVTLAGATDLHALTGIIPLPVDGSTPKRLVVFAPIQEGSSIRIVIHTRKSEKVCFADATGVRTIDNSLGPVYLLDISITDISDED